MSFKRRAAVAKLKHAVLPVVWVQKYFGRPVLRALSFGRGCCIVKTRVFFATRCRGLKHAPIATVSVMVSENLNGGRALECFSAGALARTEPGA